MNKRSISLLALLGVTMFCQADGGEKMNIYVGEYGLQSYGKETVPFIQGNGTVVLEGTEVLGLVQVNGSLNARESAMDALLVNGQVDLYSCLVHKPSRINGLLTADNTKFGQELIVAAQLEWSDH